MTIAITLERVTGVIGTGHILTQLALSPADWHAVALSLRVSLLATLGCVLVGVPVAAWLARGRSPWRFAVDVALMTPLVVPPVVTGFGLLLLFRFVGVALLFTWWAAAAAAAVVAMPLMIRTVRASIEQTDRRLARVATTLGASPWRVFWTITLPLSWRGVVGGTALSWARAFGEFGATIVVAGNMPGKTRTLPLAIWTSLQSKPLGACVGLVVAAIVLSVAAVAWSEWVIRKAPGAAHHVSDSYS